MTSPIPDTVALRRLPKEEWAQDRHIRKAVRTALQSSGYRALWNLRCEMREGVIFLLGVVPSFFLKQVAQEVLLRLGHVKEVRNLVVVTEEPTIATPPGITMVAPRASLLNRPVG